MSIIDEENRVYRRTEISDSIEGVALNLEEVVDEIDKRNPASLKVKELPEYKTVLDAIRNLRSTITTKYDRINMPYKD